jgi:hypothetical protein
MRTEASLPVLRLTRHEIRNRTHPTITAIQQAAQDCRACPPNLDATQAVIGEGPASDARHAAYHEFVTDLKKIAAAM